MTVMTVDFTVLNSLGISRRFFLGNRTFPKVSEIKLIRNRTFPKLSRTLPRETALSRNFPEAVFGKPHFPETFPSVISRKFRESTFRESSGEQAGRSLLGTELCVLPLRQHHCCRCMSCKPSRFRMAPIVQIII